MAEERRCPKALLAKPYLPKGGGTALAVGGFLKRYNINP